MLLHTWGCRKAHASVPWLPKARPFDAMDHGLRSPWCRILPPVDTAVPCWRRSRGGFHGQAKGGKEEGEEQSQIEEQAEEGLEGAVDAKGRAQGSSSKERHAQAPAGRDHAHGAREREPA